jgi:uncharacterized protein YgiM (DUF1202 family)
MQELQQWFLRGGWQYVLAALALIILILFLFSWFSQSSRDATLRANAAATATAQAAQRQALQQPSVTPGAAPAAPAPGGGQGTFVVTGTATEGLFLRTQPRAPSEILATLPEGTRVTAIGDEQDGPGPNGETLRWRQVRTEDNREGWVAASFLQPAP